MPNVFFNRGKYQLSTGNSNWTSATISIALMSSTYSSPDPDSNTFSQISANELSVTNYTRQTLESKTTTEDDTNDYVSFDAADPSWTSLGDPAGGQIITGAVVFFSGSTDATSNLICFLDLTNTTVNGGTVSITFPAAGVFTLA